jgi:hypothetical protein
VTNVTRPVEVDEKVGQWYTAYEAIRAELTPAPMRTILAEMSEVDGIAQLQSYMSLARNVMANDRAAATVAAMLVATGIKPIAVGYGDSDE